MTTHPKPTAVPTWDSNLTNTVPIVSGHKTDGYATNEVPTSAEFNTQLNLFGQWDTFLNELATYGGGAVGQLDIGSVVEIVTAPDPFGTKAFTFDGAGIQLAATAHGFVNGLGPVQFTTSGTLPMGLSPATNYWIWVYDANHFKAATSQANALSGTTINTNSAGSGTFAANSSGSTVAPSPSALVTHRDWKGNARSTIDHLGFVGGPVTVFQEKWLVTGTGAQLGWTYTTNSGTGTFPAQNPTPGLFNQRYGGFSIPSAANIQAATGGMFAVDDNTVAVFEFDVGPGTVPASLVAQIGLLDSTLANGLYILLSGANTVYSTSYVVSSTPTNMYAGVAQTIGVVHRMRLEVIGANATSNAAGTAQLRWYIDGQLIEVVNTSALAGLILAPTIKAVSSANAGAGIGVMTLSISRVLSGDNV